MTSLARTQLLPDPLVPEIVASVPTAVPAVHAIAPRDPAADPEPVLAQEAARAEADVPQAPRKFVGQAPDQLPQGPVPADDPAQAVGLAASSPCISAKVTTPSK